METLSVTSINSCSMEMLQNRLAKHWLVENSQCNILAVHGMGSRAFLHFDTDEGSSEGNRLLVDYSNIELAKKILEIIANDSSFTVDNDFGTVLPGDAFVNLCKEKLNWDWRVSSTD